MECVAFHFLNSNVEYHDSSGSDCVRMVGRNMKNHFHSWIMNWLLWVQSLHSLRVFRMCWRRLYRVLDSCIVNTRSWPKVDAPLDGNKCCDDISIKMCTHSINYRVRRTVAKHL